MEGVVDEPGVTAFMHLDEGPRVPHFVNFDSLGADDGQNSGV